MGQVGLTYSGGAWFFWGLPHLLIFAQNTSNAHTPNHYQSPPGVENTDSRHIPQETRDLVYLG